MGNIFQSNAYKNRSVDIPSNSPLFNDRRHDIEKEEGSNYYNEESKHYEVFINTIKNNRLRSNSDSIYLCCKERNYYEENNYKNKSSNPNSI